MAIKTIDLVINTSRGEKNVKQLHRIAKQVEKTFGNLNKLKINIKTDTAQKKLSALEKEINKGNRKIDAFLKTANPGMRFFGNSIGKARDNLAAVRKAFDDATSATARQNGATTLLAGNFRKLRMEAVAFAQASGQDPSKTIGNVSARIKEIQGFPRTIMAGNEAMTLLKRMQDMTIAGSKEFLLVSKAIGEQLKINATIQMQASRAAKPMTASTAFVTQEQINALGKNKLVPPSMRLPAAGESSGTFEIESKPIEKAVKNIQKSSAKTANILTQQSAFGLLPPAGGTTSPINRPGRFSPTNLGFGRNANPQGIFAMPGGMTGRLKGAAGSAMIGGGFPALFGAGGISSIMGGIAGGVGGALAPGGGFAASILATAAAAQIEKTIAFRKELNKVNLELESMGIASLFSRKQIKELAKEFKITNDEAIKLATTFKTFGAGQADMLLSAFGSREVFDALSGLRTTEAVLGKIESIREEISETTRQDLLQTLATKGSLETQAKLERVIFEQRKKAFVEKEIDKIKILDIPKEFRATEALQKEFGNIKRLELGREFENANGGALKLLETQIKINEQMQFLSEFNAPAEELRELLNPMRQILDLSTSMRTSFEESFAGIIKGTMSVQDAFRNMLSRIADHFVSTAARLAAAQMQKGFLSSFSNLFSFNSFTRDPIRATPTLTSEQIQNRFAFSDSRRANGGVVNAGKSYMVGERGAEMFVPNAGGRIVPNSDLGGSTNIVVNVDASGSSVEGNEGDGRELGRLISVAVQSEIISQQRPGGLLA
jgi:hypothetical protein